MSLGLIGKKQGMTRVFTQEGKSFPVTVVSIDPNVVTQVKTTEKDGYSSIQVTTGEKKEKTSWHRIFIFNDVLAGVVESYLKKGSKI